MVKMSSGIGASRGLRGTAGGSEGRRILDDATRHRRQKKALDALEMDNFQDDPHANLVMHKKAPKFDENLETKTPKRRRTRTSEYLKQRFKKNFAMLLEEERTVGDEAGNSYSKARAPPSCFSPRKFCAVCGDVSPYTCISCGARYCSVKCQGTHADTRCLKWTA
ncbi:unnamed protein product [Darwinula stevensoni]|uniref:HIT-type domain-containing protein n=1 Tax=Darwinula stevensoni TaxID=69355 RepID=A0A7R9AG05_9CRUS|nr:unnamed protein product [Darwinula stevensoni]CAG0903542.1 unnamed protein product [Darwinula stevensoni]